MAYWLRSSVVSVLISLISDTSSIWGPYIKPIFRTGSWKRGLLRSLHASTWYCSAARNGAPFLFPVTKINNKVPRENTRSPSQTTGRVMHTTKKRDSVAQERAKLEWALLLRWRTHAARINPVASFLGVVLVRNAWHLLWLHWIEYANPLNTLPWRQICVPGKPFDDWLQLPVVCFVFTSVHLYMAPASTVEMAKHDYLREFQIAISFGYFFFVSPWSHDFHRSTVGCHTLFRCFVVETVFHLLVQIGLISS